jgi:Zn finger protein HypA/HybF involved in hydrogenase expression
MQIATYLLAPLLGVFGLLFLIAAGQGNSLVRIVIGVVLLGSALALLIAARLRPVQQTMVQKIDLSGGVAAEQLKCKSCGGTLGPKSVTVRAGAVFVQCEYCGTSNQLEEEPKW